MQKFESVIPQVFLGIATCLLIVLLASSNSHAWSDSGLSSCQREQNRLVEIEQQLCAAEARVQEIQTQLSALQAARVNLTAAEDRQISALESEIHRARRERDAKLAEICQHVPTNCRSCASYKRTQAHYNTYISRVKRQITRLNAAKKARTSRADRAILRCQTDLTKAQDEVTQLRIEYDYASNLWSNCATGLR